MKPVTFLLVLASAAFAQNDGITAYASRTVYVQPDQIEATIALTTPATITSQQAANILQTAAIPSRMVSAATADTNFANRVLDRGTPSFVYTFAHSVAGSDMRDLVKKLETVQNTRSADYSSLSYATALTATQALLDDQFQRVLPQMIVDARKRAEVLAAAAGLKVGAVQTISETSPNIASSSGKLALTFSIAVKFATN